MRTHTMTIRASLWMAILLSTAAAAQPADATTPPGRVAVVHDRQDDQWKQVPSEVGMMPDSTAAQNALRGTAPRTMPRLNPIPATNDLQPNGPLRLIVMAALLLLAAGVGLHAWHDSVTNNRML